MLKKNLLLEHNFIMDSLKRQGGSLIGEVNNILFIFSSAFGNQFFFIQEQISMICSVSRTMPSRILEPKQVSKKKIKAKEPVKKVIRRQQKSI